MEGMALPDHVVTQCRATADEDERDEPDNPNGNERTHHDVRGANKKPSHANEQGKSDYTAPDPDREFLTFFGVGGLPTVVSTEPRSDTSLLGHEPAGIPCIARPATS